MMPFKTREEAAYWGGGVLVEAGEGEGWWSLHGYGTPSGPVLYHIGKNGRIEGLPTGFVWGRADDGGAAKICRET